VSRRDIAAYRDRVFERSMPSDVRALDTASRKEKSQNKRLEPDSDSIRTIKALDCLQRGEMFKSLLVPIDLTDTDLPRPRLATAATLSQNWKRWVRRFNVLPMTRVDDGGRRAGPISTPSSAWIGKTKEALTIVARESGIRAGRAF